VNESHIVKLDQGKLIVYVMFEKIGNMMLSSLRGSNAYNCFNPGI
jgi:hypothetical protein